MNPLTGRWVTIATGRADRPEDFVSRNLAVESEPGRQCPFCPGNEEATPPALEIYGGDGAWQVRVVPNKYPAFEDDAPLRVEEVGKVFSQAGASGIHEVLVFSPHHLRGWEDLDDKQCALVMAAIRDRIEEHGRHDPVRYTQVIVNHGREAGASLEHGHGQLLGVPFVPTEISEEIDGFARYDGECLLCATVEEELNAGHRVVLENDKVAVISPFWSGVPFEMLVVPRGHERAVDHTHPGELVAAGRATRDALALLRDRLGEVAYNLVFHTAPHHDDVAFHWHIHIVPRLTTAAGFEQGTGVLINVVAPEAATQHLLRD